MAAVNYLNGGEAPTAALMNSLWSEFDRKFSLMLGGRTFALAWDHPTLALPNKLLGRCFFFTSGRTRYAQRFPEAINTAVDGTFVPRAYRHSTFTNALASMSPASYDEAKHIANFAAAADGAYDGLPVYHAGSLFDHSLEAHTVSKPGGTQKYFVRSNRNVPGNVTLEEQSHEKIYRYAVAEIICEGTPTTDPVVEIEANWNKYNFFRIHNLNHYGITVRFAGGGVGPTASFGIGPLQCITVRRDPGTATTPPSNYRLGFTYFWRFEPGDPRLYWFWPTTINGATAVIGRGMQTPSNGMEANNVSNPALLFDWWSEFAADQTKRLGGRFGKYCWFYFDSGVWENIYPQYSALLANPADGNARLGDLTRHRGKIAIIKIHKTERLQPQNIPRCQIDEVTFNGFETVTTDFAAKNLTVTRDGNGDLQISKGAGDANWNYTLIPISTNLFKTGEDQNAAYGLGTITIERNFFELNQFPIAPFIADESLLELQDEGGRSERQVQPVTATVAPARVNFVTFPGEVQTPGFVLGDDIVTPSYNSNVVSARIFPRGIDVVRASEVRDLRFFGPSDGNFNTPYGSYALRDFILTEEGLKLRFRHYFRPQFLRVPAFAQFVVKYPATGLTAAGDLECERVIHFRGHGWPFGQLGRDYSAALIPVHDRYHSSNYWENETISSDGIDFRRGVLGLQSFAARMLRRIKTSMLTQKPVTRFPGTPLEQQVIPWQARFWQLPRVDYAAEASTMLGQGELAVSQWYAGLAARGLNPPAPTPIERGLSRHDYNLMARYVNGMHTAQPLKPECLRIWYVDTFNRTVLGTLPGPNIRWDQPGPISGPSPLPVPMRCYYALPGRNADSNARRFFQTLGVPIRTEAELPDAEMRRDHKVFRHLNIETAATIEQRLVGTEPDESTIWDVFGNIADTGSHFVDDESLGGRADYEAAYAGFRWVHEDDVAAAFNQLSGGGNFPFTYIEPIVPMEFAMSALAGYERGQFHEWGSMHKIGRFQMRQFRDPTPPLNEAFAIANAGFQFLRAKVHGFIAARQPATAPWKMPALTGAETIATRAYQNEVSGTDPICVVGQWGHSFTGFLATFGIWNEYDVTGYSGGALEPANIGTGRVFHFVGLVSDAQTHLELQGEGGRQFPSQTGGWTYFLGRRPVALRLRSSAGTTVRARYGVFPLERAEVADDWWHASTRAANLVGIAGPYPRVTGGTVQGGPVTLHAPDATENLLVEVVSSQAETIVVASREGKFDAMVYFDDRKGIDLR